MGLGKSIKINERDKSKTGRLRRISNGRMSGLKKQHYMASLFSAFSAALQALWDH